jgi:uncharacterized protein YndB with AHSA1/START domain
MENAMAEHAHSSSIDLDPDTVFAYLADVEHLPHYFPGMTGATVTGRDEQHSADKVEVTANVDGDHHDGVAWFRADPSTRAIEWGSVDDNEYQGTMRVEAADAGSRLELTLSTPHVPEGALDLEENVQAIRDALAHQQGASA